MWCFPAFGEDRELVWLRATRSQHVGATRITHQAAMRLGSTQSVTEAYQVQLRLSSEPRFILRAEGVETLECIRSRSERRGARALKPDVIIGWSDWNKVQPFVMSGWAVSGQTLPGKAAPATKWHLRMNHKGSPTFLNVELDPMRKRSTITHEAAVRIGLPYEEFYMLFARAEDGEVRNLVAVGADAIVRADRRRPTDPAGKGPDLLMNAKKGCRQYGQVSQTGLEERAGDRRPRRLPCGRTVARKAEGPAGSQGSWLDMRAVRENRQGL